MKCGSGYYVVVIISLKITSRSTDVLEKPVFAELPRNFPPITDDHVHGHVLKNQQYPILFL